MELLPLERNFSIAMKKTLYSLTVLFCALSLFAGEIIENTKDGVAIKGYDPVSYHQGEPLKGSEEWTFNYAGAEFHFASEENLKSFEADPERYVPEYGGWCAYAMLEGDKVDINPKRYKILNGRLYLFYDGFFGNTLKKWNHLAEDQEESDLVKQADDHWKKLSNP